MPSVTKQSPNQNSKIIPNGSIFDAAIPVEELAATGYQFLLFGESGSGKTTIACSFPKPLLLIRPEEVEDGSQSVRTVKGVSVSPHITDPDQILDICDGQARTNRYKTIVLDGLTAMQDLVVKKHMGLQDVPVQNTWGMVPQTDWNWIGITVKDFVRALLRLNKMGTHVVLVCGEKMFKIKGEEESGGISVPKIMAALTPSATAFIHHTVNYSIHTFKRLKTIETDTGTKVTNKKEFGVHVDENITYATKFRIDRGLSVKLPEIIINPTFEHFDKLINGIPLVQPTVKK